MSIRGHRDRLIRHAWVLVAAALVLLLAPRATATLVGSVTASHAPEDIILSAIIERPATVPPIAARPAQTIVVAPGQTVAQLAAAAHSDVAAIRWANDLGRGAAAAPGTTLLLPPGPGALVRVQPGERPSHFAKRLNIDPRVLLDYNALTADTPRPAGSYLQVPIGSAPSGSLVGRFFSWRAGGLPSVTPDGTGSDGFPFGQCTYYVALHRLITWAGDAWTWFDHANGIRPEGHTPVAGAIAVFHDGWSGHVAFVESVFPDGSFTVSEMNYYGNGGGWGRVDQRTIAGGDRGITGFIY